LFFGLSTLLTSFIDGGGTNFEVIGLGDTGLDYGNCFFDQTTAPPSDGAADLNLKVFTAFCSLSLSLSLYHPLVTAHSSFRSSSI
jgi:hypothetical protein